MDQSNSGGQRQSTAKDGAALASQTPITAMPGPGSADRSQVEKNLATFDRLDFEGWNGPNWDLFRQFHADHVHVEGFGTTTDGIDPHVKWAQDYIAAHPNDYKIVAHPIRIGAGDWTAVVGSLANGGTMATLARWENGRIVEEYLFSLME